MASIFAGLMPLDHFETTETLPPRLRASTAMASTARALGGVLALVLLPACSSVGSGPAAEPPPPVPTTTGREGDPTTADGIYTLAQARRGEDLFEGVCSECHDAADWTEAGFKGRWEDSSVFLLWYFINDRMPYDDPWSLSRQQVTDVLTYILQINGLRAGDTELATDDDSIDDYWIAWGSGTRPLESGLGGPVATN